MRSQDQTTGIRIAACATGLIAAFSGPLAVAQEIQGTDVDFSGVERRLKDTSRKLEELKRLLAEEERKLSADRRALEEQRRLMNQQMQKLAGRGAAPSTGTVGGSPGGAAASGMLITQAGQKPDETGAREPGRPVGEAPPPAEEPLRPARIFAEQGVLTPGGKLVIEPALQYFQSSDNRVALVGFTIIPAITIGLINIQQVSRDSFVPSLTARYGITPRFEAQVFVPYVSSSSDTITRPIATPSVTDQFFSANGSGIGDVEATFRYQINQFRGDNAVWVGYVRGRAPTGEGPYQVSFDPVTNLQTELPTGTGFWGVQPGFTVLYPSDPVVFFGGAGYLFNLSRDVGNGFGTIDPGDQVDFNFGMGLSLNERASFSFGYQQSIVMSTGQSGNVAPSRTLGQTGTLEVGSARFGLSYKVTPRSFINLTLGVGVTEQAPDLELRLGVPIEFL